MTKKHAPIMERAFVGFKLFEFGLVGEDFVVSEESFELC